MQLWEELTLVTPDAGTPPPQEPEQALGLSCGKGGQAHLVSGCFQTKCSWTLLTREVKSNLRGTGSQLRKASWGLRVQPSGGVLACPAEGLGFNSQHHTNN